MNILIPDSWLKEYLKTKAPLQKIAECLSLCGPSVEKINKVGNDFVYEIEITTNRIDMASIQGVAREAAAILPRFRIKAKFLPPKPKTLAKPARRLPLTIKNDPKLCRRVTAVILDNVKIKPSPQFVRQRLKACGVRSLNNLIDITNYVMLEIGHPTHAFDYDRIKTHQLIIRRAKKGEKIVTLEGKKHTLPGGDTVIDDGAGEIIDLPGIIGTENSVVTPTTKRVLFFIENNDPYQMRKTSMTLDIRTMAATINEKGPDPNLMTAALFRGVELYKKFANAQVASEIFDIYPQSYIPKKIKISLRKIKEQLGVEISKKEVVNIFKSLGFKSLTCNSEFIVQVPSWRANDISIPEDLIEEIARIYGYHHLPTCLPTGEFPKPFKGPFLWEEKTKDTLKYWGFTEVYNYSFISESLLKTTGFNLQNCLKLSNPLTSEWEYMRSSLIPEILKNIAENRSGEEKIKIFELSNVYLPKKGNLPDEKPMLVGALTGEKFYQARGVVEALLEELGMKNVSFSSTIVKKNELWHPGRTAMVTVKKRGKELGLGTVGEVHPNVLEKFEMQERVTVFELDFEEVLKYATQAKSYAPIPKYPSIVEDLAFIVPEKTLVGKIIEEIKQLSNLVSQVELLDSYKDTRTFKIIYQHPKRTLTDSKVKKIREKIIKKLKTKFQAQLKAT